MAENHLQSQFDVQETNRVWGTDITYIRTHEGWLYLAAVLDLFSRQVIGGAMGQGWIASWLSMRGIWPYGAASPDRR